MKIKEGGLKIDMRSKSPKSVFISAGTNERQSTVELVLDDETLPKAISSGSSVGGVKLEVRYSNSYRTSDFTYEKAVTRVGEVEIGAELAIGLALKALADKRLKLLPNDAAKILLAVSKAISR